LQLALAEVLADRRTPLQVQAVELPGVAGIVYEGER
jgi:hypothetical protein